MAACPFGGLREATSLQLAYMEFAVTGPERLWEFAPSAEGAETLSLLRVAEYTGLPCACPPGFDERARCVVRGTGCLALSPTTASSFRPAALAPAPGQPARSWCTQLHTAYGSPGAPEGEPGARARDGHERPGERDLRQNLRRGIAGEPRARCDHHAGSTELQRLAGTRRPQLPGALRRHNRRQLGPRGGRFHRCPRQEHWSELMEAGQVVRARRDGAAPLR